MDRWDGVRKTSERARQNRARPGGDKEEEKEEEKEKEKEEGRPDWSNAR